MKTKSNQKKLMSSLLFFCMVFSISWAQTDEVVVIDSEYTQKSIVLEQLPQSTTVIEVGHSENPWKTVRHFLEDNTTVKTIHLFADTSNNALQLGGIAYDSERIDQEFELSMLEGVYQGTNIQLLVYDCNLGSNVDGLAIIKQISAMSYFNIATATNCTSVFDSNFSFDYKTMNQPISSSIFK
ncbi:DUF4347 domain-containing protein [Cytophaga sp. FL35]|uniref:DUF4347 domain-containing protein n=1 Tax=Cytophaga sp. FL35 TaxID=1904456 RepID=UPI000C8EF00A|nr:DUF4347 domain-containing protein [Cytophaga sp. FL35]MBC7000814.1 DUF4347 domain-containing protein [Cytophaga sp. FL35]MBG48007.1 hypothetical protein [Pseudozobellia sp.]|tara:strand:+ start:30 stop:578 length:549 start_codon:yes stop_codon:yes gene_type:complete